MERVLISRDDRFAVPTAPGKNHSKSTINVHYIPGFWQFTVGHLKPDLTLAPAALARVFVEARNIASDCAFLICSS